ncbi:hypothetical protein K9M74_05395, partial [Candidatus Woesearchaeota archaeon]|nr:hypothetical protein [Candidatus Woesearchaeota archaeon]
FPLMTNPQYKRSIKKKVNEKKAQLILEANGMKQSTLFGDTNMVSYDKFYNQLVQQVECVMQAYNHAKAHKIQAEKLNNNSGFHLALAKTYQEIKTMQKEL